MTDLWLNSDMFEGVGERGLENSGIVVGIHREKQHASFWTSFEGNYEK